MRVMKGTGRWECGRSQVGFQKQVVVVSLSHLSATSLRAVWHGASNAKLMEPRSEKS